MGDTTPEWGGRDLAEGLLGCALDCTLPLREEVLEASLGRELLEASLREELLEASLGSSFEAAFIEATVRGARERGWY